MKVTLAHRNTEATTLLPDTDNDKVAWIVLEKNDGTQEHFFPQNAEPRLYEWTCYKCGKCEKDNIPLGGYIICDDCDTDPLPVAPEED